MRALIQLVVELAMLAVVAAAAFGLWSAVAPDKAKGARGRAIRAADRLTRDDPPAEAGTTVSAHHLLED